jgi:hypothetical protein
MRVVCASVSYCPETWAQPGDAQMVARFVRALEGRQAPGAAAGGEEEAAAGAGQEEEQEGDGDEEGRRQEHEREYGAGWSNVAEHLPTRTDSQCRCVYSSCLSIEDFVRYARPPVAD